MTLLSNKYKLTLPLLKNSELRIKSRKSIILSRGH